MKKKLLILSIIFSCLLLPKVEAKCNDENINALAREINAGFNVFGFEREDGSTYNRSTLIVENIPEDMYLIIINNATSKKETFKDIKDGYVETYAPDINNIYDYTVKIYSSNSACENELLRTVGVSSKVFNFQSMKEECTLLYEDPKYMGDFEPCEEYTSKHYDDETFYKEYKAYIEQQPENIKNTLTELFYKYYWFALIPMAILAVYYIVRVTIIKRRKKKDEEE